MNSSVKRGEQGPTFHSHCTYRALYRKLEEWQDDLKAYVIEGDACSKTSFCLPRTSVAAGYPMRRFDRS
jgi:hypothetical protein